METTLAFFRILENSVFIAHIGNSRVYHIRPNDKTILFQTKDHSLATLLVESEMMQVNDPRLLQLSRITSKAIQIRYQEREQADIYQTSDIQSGDYFFLCSDGVLENLNNLELLKILCDPIEDNCKMKQIESICAEKSTDNYSTYLIRVL